MVKVRCKLQGCKAQLTNPENVYCSKHKYKRDEKDDVFSKRNVGRKSD